MRKQAIIFGLSMLLSLSLLTSCKGFWKDMKELKHVKTTLEKANPGKTIQLQIRYYSLGGKSKNSLNITVSNLKNIARSKKNKTFSKGLASLALKSYKSKHSLHNINVILASQTRNAFLGFQAQHVFSFSRQELAQETNTVSAKKVDSVVRKKGMFGDASVKKQPKG